MFLLKQEEHRHTDGKRRDDKERNQQLNGCRIFCNGILHFFGLFQKIFGAAVDLLFPFLAAVIENNLPNSFDAVEKKRIERRKTAAVIHSAGHIR